MASLKPLILMMAGGTGGHVYPALAVASELIARGYRVEWVGTNRGLEYSVVPAAGINLHCLPVRGMRGKGLLQKVTAVFALLLAALSSVWLVFRLAPSCVVGMGGYVAGPAGAAAWLLRKPLLIHEQNAVAGTTNRMLAPLATKIVGGFPGAFASGVEYTVLGNPVRSDLIKARDNSKYSYSGDRALRLLVLGGSLGARPINEVMPEVVSELATDPATSIEVQHQTGKAHLADVESAYGAQLNQGVHVAAFIEDMAQAYAWADVVLCRAGALTVAELATVGRPSILVPLPHAIDDHQSANARVLAECGGATVLVQSDLNVASVVQLLRDFIAQPARLRAMAVASFAAATPDAAQRVSDCCEELMHA
ncbi:MAG: UDP-N-acetylglucosamine--N-acetylmuramyl-(pentapeptide) pyrophosphoryl-undecaprenol N-acetylglucosamine transferase [Halioglobus sp.]|jgi:UDP-N-acetylglucosamine--N-acetylmuramyl-(pentapeptide) pyrophosphoryl-undecaprenol N-acetylglucosamine transferase